MAIDERINARTSESDTEPAESFQLLARAPSAFAVTHGQNHALVYANAAFHALTGSTPIQASGLPVGNCFEPSVASRITLLLDRALRESCALSEQFLGPLEAGGRPWSITVWPLLDDAHGLVVELFVATHHEATLALQREVAERLLLSALRETEAAEHAQDSHQRAAFLASTGRELAESLDTEATQNIVARLSLPPLAEWCIVDLLEPDQTMHRLTIVHRDPSKLALINQLHDKWLPRAGDPFGAPAVLGEARPVQVAENVDDALRTAAHDAANLRILADLGIGPLLTVPLVGANGVFGAITFVGAQRDRAFTQQDIELAEGLAAGSALALEKARLYGEALILKDKAEASAKNTTRFLGTIGHELRTPLQAISGYAELMSRGIHGPVTDEQRSDLDRILASQQHLLVLISELLDFMRVGSGRGSYQAVDVPLNEAVAHAIATLEPLIVLKSLTCEVVSAPGIAATADPDRVNQILINIVSNAVKFTDAGGRITISWHAGEDTVAIEVSDTGRGIPADKLEAIFEPFVQAHLDDSKQLGGVGLGLAISRDLARAMRGDLTVSSRIGEGSTFTLTLPARADERAEAEKPGVGR